MIQIAKPANKKSPLTPGRREDYLVVLLGCGTSLYKIPEKAYSIASTHTVNVILDQKKSLCRYIPAKKLKTAIVM
jgi:hypothetical protein